MTLVKYRNNGTGSFNNFIDDFFTTIPSIYREGFATKSNQFFPAVNVTEREDGYEMEVAAPGFEKEQFAINVEEKQLVISAEVKTENVEEKLKSIRKEFTAKSFKRSFSLDDNIDANAISAKYVNGILIVNLPKKKDVKEDKKQITVS